MKLWQHSIISGGGSGLGLGLAERLLHRGGRVSVLDLVLGDEAHSRLRQAAQEGGGEWQYFETNLTDESSVNQAVAAAVEAFSTPNLCINSAGILVNKTLNKLDSADFKKVIDVNVTGSFHFARAVLPHLKAGDRLVLIASMAGLTSSYGYSAYGTSKFAVVGLATTLRYEYEALGIGITCVCPPEVKTPMVAVERSPGQADPIALALKDIAGSLEPDFACDAILKGIDKGQWLVIPGTKSKLTAMGARYFPNAFMALSTLIVRHLMKKHSTS
ncbi:short-chain dehydrogenase/reductase SDR [gamma proteobacterium HTCC5015]|nr:short-chain dehydrogenase/reductase SDR [gamma proteobacterium HTCC5015]